MNGLTKTLALASALCLLSGTATAKDVRINCQNSAKCVHYEEMGKSQTDGFIAQCNGGTVTGMSLVCHPVKNMTCTKGKFDPDHEAYTCACTNWSATKKQTATIDVLCPT